MTSDQERAAPAQQPVASKPLRYCDYCKSWYSKPCGAGCVWHPDMPTELPPSSEPELRAEIVRLTRERDAAVENYNRTWNQRDAQRRRAEAAESRVEALSAEVGKLTEANLDLRLALTPFAEVEITRIDPPDSEPVNCKHINGLFYGHFREARAALDKGATA